MTAWQCLRCDGLFDEPNNHVIYKQTFNDPEESVDLCSHCGHENFVEIELTEEEES